MNFKANQSKGKELTEEKPYLEMEDGYSPGALSTRVLAGLNNAYETTKDLAKIAESLRTSSPKKYRRKVK